jgi:hypothetical protein
MFVVVFGFLAAERLLGVKADLFWPVGEVFGDSVVALGFFEDEGLLGVAAALFFPFGDGVLVPSVASSLASA